MRSIHGAATKTAAVVFAICLVPLAPAQAPAGQAAQGATAAPAGQTVSGADAAPADQASGAANAVVPPGQQATREQLTKLFEVMRLRQQFDSMTKMMPAIIEQQVHAQMDGMAAGLPGGNPLSAQQQAALDKLTAKYLQ